MRFPASSAAIVSGSVLNGSLYLLKMADSMLSPRTRSLTPLATVSTSGNSGMGGRFQCNEGSSMEEQQHLPEYDPQTQIRRVPFVFKKEGCLNRQAAQSRYIFNTGAGKTARKGGAVLQKALIYCSGRP